MFGIPKILQSNRGTNLTSHMFGQVFNMFKIKHNLSWAWRAQSQSELEGFHQTLESLHSDDCIDQVGSAKFESKFDLLKAFRHVPL